MSIATANILTQLESYQERYTALRRRLHATPETAYEEHRTAELVAQELESYGLAVYRGIGRTGVVGVLSNRASQRAVGLRADMDALNISEENELPYRSEVPGKMHACGHDGHTAMLLLAARHLSETRAFAGTVVFIFQPAEEGGAGARRMIRDGLFERFPVDAVYGMHNIPGIEAGHFAVMPGPMMAAADYFELHIQAEGAHAALPHRTADPILAGSALVLALQSLVSRSIDPLDPAVLSVTQFHGGEASNAIPASAVLKGTARSYSPEARAALIEGIRRVAAGTAASYGLAIDVRHQPGYPPTINSHAETIFAYHTLEELVGQERVRADLRPLMTAEDFAYMLQARPGAYIWIGNGPSQGLHTPRYDFNDDILTTGAAAWVRLAEESLPQR
ncbi:amidohydrolase [Chloroflexia bacterium SDU3-3]|nr:amidohydrolase [Chloroflexia bacterium SDU3-3]